MTRTRARADGFYLGALALAAEHEANPAYVRLFTVLAAESIEDAHPAHDWFVARYRRARANVGSQIAEEQRRGRLNANVEPDVLAALVIAILDGLELQFLLDPDRIDIVKPLTMLFDLLAESSTHEQTGKGSQPPPRASPG